MKRRDFLAFLFFLLAFLFPGICLASKLLDYTLLVHSGRHFAVLSTLLYGILGILLLHREEKTAGAVSAVLLSLCPFLNQMPSFIRKTSSWSSYSFLGRSCLL